MTAHSQDQWLCKQVLLASFHQAALSLIAPENLGVDKSDPGEDHLRPIFFLICCTGTFVAAFHGALFQDHCWGKQVLLAMFNSGSMITSRLQTLPSFLSGLFWKSRHHKKFWSSVQCWQGRCQMAGQGLYHKFASFIWRHDSWQTQQRSGLVVFQASRAGRKYPR